MIFFFSTDNDSISLREIIHVCMFALASVSNWHSLIYLKKYLPNKLLCDVTPIIDSIFKSFRNKYFHPAIIKNKVDLSFYFSHQKKTKQKNIT